MKCKACKREIPEESIYCLHCGEKVLRTRKGKKQISVPKPKLLADGRYRGQIMVDGERVLVYGATPEEYKAAAVALKARIVEAKAKPQKITLEDAIRNYIDERTHVLSPSTIRGYEIVYRNRFKAYKSKDIHSINYQTMINDEAVIVSPKTVNNAWGVVASAIAAAGVIPPKVNKPKVPEKDGDWLDYEQIKTFLSCVKGQPVEIAALLALHGLRLSELLDLDVSQIKNDVIMVRGATVMDKDNNMVHKSTNKNKTSRRDVPVLIPRLLEILPASGKVVTQHPSAIERGIKRVCRSAGLPVCSAHDLRRSFASLAYHLQWSSRTTMDIGGWSNLATVEKVYQKLATQDKNKDIKKMQAFFANRKITTKITTT